MRCELVQRPTIFKADRPMNHELVSSHHCLSCNKFRAQLRAAKRKSQTTIFPSEVFTPSNQLRMWHFPVSANLINLKLPWFFLLLVNCSKCLSIVRPCPHLTFLSSEIWGFFFFFFFFLITILKKQIYSSSSRRAMSTLAAHWACTQLWLIIKLKSRDAGGFERHRFRSMNTDLHRLSAHGRPS